MEITVYIINNLHYSHKFNLANEILHPLDLLKVIEKFKSE